MLRSTAASDLRSTAPAQSSQILTSHEIDNARPAQSKENTGERVQQGSASSWSYAIDGAASRMVTVTESRDLSVLASRSCLRHLCHPDGSSQRPCHSSRRQPCNAEYQRGAFVFLSTVISSHAEEQSSSFALDAALASHYEVRRMEAYAERLNERIDCAKTARTK